MWWPDQRTNEGEIDHGFHGFHGWEPALLAAVLLFVLAANGFSAKDLRPRLAALLGLRADRLSAGSTAMFCCAPAAFNLNTAPDALIFKLAVNTKGSQ
ncbi:MAG: hypothetical protein ACLQM8_05280 [Limisphaerales bacterium]